MINIFNTLFHCSLVILNQDKFEERKKDRKKERMKERKKERKKKRTEIVVILTTKHDPQC